MIDSDHGRRVFALEVGGLLYRYHSGGGVTGLECLYLLDSWPCLARMVASMVKW